jgi:hypothetical protein
MVESVMSIGLRLSGVFCRLRFVSLYTPHFFCPTSTTRTRICFGE